jgi:serine/threonine protein kinase
MKRMTSDRSTRASLFPRGSTRRATPAELVHSGGFREKSLVLDAAVDEYLRLQREGKPVSKDEFCARYPDYRHSLKRLIDVEEALPAFEELDNDFWPEVGGCFLGYDILDLLGAGSIARVFLASEVKLGGRAVAIKVSRHGGYEAETLGKLRHSNIVEVYSVNHDEETDLTVVCMPYQGSATLSDLLDEVYRDDRLPTRAKVISEVGRRMALPEAISEEEIIASNVQRTLDRGSYVDGVVHLGMQLASALQYAHDHGVLHRDLKPSNVLLTPQGRPMLLDFNLSFDAALNMVHRGGTLPYSAPEQLNEANQEGPTTTSLVDARADVFSLGAILYELLSGKLPYGSPPSNVGPRHAIQLQLDAQKTPPVSLRQSNVDAYLESIILRCLHRDPTQRFASMLELEGALREYFQGSRRVKRWIQRHRYISSVVAGILGLTLLSAVVFVATIPPYYERQRRLAVAALERHDVHKAIDYLDASLATKPDFGDALFLRGVAHQMDRKHLDAVGDFEAAEQAGYDSEALWSYWGYSLWEARSIKKVGAHFDQALARYPNSANFQLAKAYVLYAFQNDNAGALKAFDQFIEANPSRFEGYFFRAILRFRLRKSSEPMDEIVHDIEDACARCTSIPVVEFEAARILAYASKFDPEAPNQKAEERAKEHVQAAVDYGWPQLSVKNTFEFKPWLKEPWFDALLERCHAKDGKPPEPSLPDLAFKPSTSLRDAIQ